MSRPLRILYHHRIRADDGQAVHVRELIGALRREGHEVLECALVPKAGAAGAGASSTGGSSTGASSTGASPIGGATGATARTSRFWQRLSLPRTAVEILEMLYDRRGGAMLRAAARRFRPHCIYERHALHCRSGLDVARQLGVPLLLEVNSPMTQEMRELGLLRFPQRARHTERAVLGGADAVLAVTRVLGDLLVAAGARPERVHVVGNGADPERYGGDAAAAAPAVRAAWQLPRDAFALGFVGYMRPWHRLELVLEVMRRPGFGALCLVLMGQGPALRPLLDGARAHGLEGRVRAVGAVPPDLLPAHVMACDAALIPAINAYASPLKLFDSLAAGVPTLAPDQPNLRENVTDGSNGLLFAPGSVESLADRLGRLVHDRGFARALGAAGRASLVAHEWTWRGNARRVAALAVALGAGDRS